MIQLFKTKDDFQKWLAQMQPALKNLIEMLPEEIRQKLDFSAESLDLLENWLLNRYSESQILMEPEQRQVWDGCARYVGETFRRELGGHWETNLKDRRYVWYGLPYLTGYSKRPTPTGVHSLVTTAIHRRSGSYIRTVLENTRRHEAKFRDAQPPVERVSELAESAVWFIMFRNGPATLDGAAAFLRSAGDWEVTVRERLSSGRLRRWVEVNHEGQLINVGLNNDPSVLQESREIAQHFGAGRPDRPRIVEYHRRFEIAYELRVDMANFNTLCLIEHALKNYLEGEAVTFMPSESTFV